MAKLTIKQITEKLGTFKCAEQYQVKNQLILHYQNGKILQSYESVCAVLFTDGKLYLSGLHDYSSTTSKYVTRFTGLNTQKRRKGLESGEIGYIVL